MFAEHSYGQASAADLAKVVIPVLRHRLKPIYDWEDRFKENSDYDKVKILDSQQRTDWLIKKFVQNTAPQINGYSDIFEQTLKEVNA